MGWRIGQFFFLVGVLVLFVFAISLTSEMLQGNLLLVGLAATGLGIFVMYKNRQPPGESQRFRRIRKLRSKNKE